MTKVTQKRLLKIYEMLTLATYWLAVKVESIFMKKKKKKDLRCAGQYHGKESFNAQAFISQFHI